MKDCRVPKRKVLLSTDVLMTLLQDRLGRCENALSHLSRLKRAPVSPQTQVI